MDRIVFSLSVLILLALGWQKECASTVASRSAYGFDAVVSLCLAIICVAVYRSKTSTPIQLGLLVSLVAVSCVLWYAKNALLYMLGCSGAAPFPPITPALLELRVIALFTMTTCVTRNINIKALTSLAALMFLPFIVMPPIAGRFLPRSFEFNSGTSWWDDYATSVALLLVIMCNGLVHSWWLQKESTGQAVKEAELLQQAAKAEALLNTAMPPQIARELMSGRPAAEISRSYNCAYVAFVCLTDYEDKLRQLSPEDVLHYLDDIYAVFDRLVDCYGDAVRKIESIGNTYVLKCASDDHDAGDSAVLMSQFCLDILDLCSERSQAFRDPLNRAKAEHVHVKIGIACGPLSAGIIGRTRRYYRIFGDCVNTASRMMSTGEVDKLQVTSEVAQAVLAADVEMTGIVVDKRGVIGVKGKGDLETYWLSREASVPAAFESGRRLSDAAEDNHHHAMAVLERGSSRRLRLAAANARAPMAHSESKSASPQPSPPSVPPASLRARATTSFFQRPRGSIGGSADYDYDRQQRLRAAASVRKVTGAAGGANAPTAYGADAMRALVRSEAPPPAPPLLHQGTVRQDAHASIESDYEGVSILTIGRNGADLSTIASAAPATTTSVRRASAVTLGLGHVRRRSSDATVSTNNNNKGRRLSTMDRLIDLVAPTPRATGASSAATSAHSPSLSSSSASISSAAHDLSHSTRLPTSSTITGLPMLAAVARYQPRLEKSDSNLSVGDPGTPQAITARSSRAASEVDDSGRRGQGDNAPSEPLLALINAEGGADTTSYPLPMPSPAGAPAAADHLSLRIRLPPQATVPSHGSSRTVWVAAASGWLAVDAEQHHGEAEASDAFTSHVTSSPSYGARMRDAYRQSKSQSSRNHVSPPPPLQRRLSGSSDGGTGRGGRSRLVQVVTESSAADTPQSTASREHTCSLRKLASKLSIRCPLKAAAAALSPSVRTDRRRSASPELADGRRGAASPSGRSPRRPAMRSGHHSPVAANGALSPKAALDASKAHRKRVSAVAESYVQRVMDTPNDAMTSGGKGGVSADGGLMPPLSPGGRHTSFRRKASLASANSSAGSTQSSASATRNVSKRRLSPLPDIVTSPLAHAPANAGPVPAHTAAGEGAEAHGPPVYLGGTGFYTASLLHDQVELERDIRHMREQRQQQAEEELEVLAARRRLSVAQHSDMDGDAYVSGPDNDGAQIGLPLDGSPHPAAEAVAVIAPVEDEHHLSPPTLAPSLRLSSSGGYSASHNNGSRGIHPSGSPGAESESLQVTALSVASPGGLSTSPTSSRNTASTGSRLLDSKRSSPAGGGGYRHRRSSVASDDSGGNPNIGMTSSAAAAMVVHGFNATHGRSSGGDSGGGNYGSLLSGGVAIVTSHSPNNASSGTGSVNWRESTSSVQRDNDRITSGFLMSAASALGGTGTDRTSTGTAELSRGSASTTSHSQQGHSSRGRAFRRLYHGGVAATGIQLMRIQSTDVILDHSDHPSPTKPGALASPSKIHRSASSGSGSTASALAQGGIKLHLQLGSVVSTTHTTTSAAGAFHRSNSTGSGDSGGKEHRLFGSSNAPMPVRRSESPSPSSSGNRGLAAADAFRRAFSAVGSDTRAAYVSPNCTSGSGTGGERTLTSQPSGSPLSDSLTPTDVIHSLAPVSLAERVRQRVSQGQKEAQAAAGAVSSLHRAGVPSVLPASIAAAQMALRKGMTAEGTERLRSSASKPVADQQLMSIVTDATAAVGAGLVAPQRTGSFKLDPAMPSNASLDTLAFRAAAGAATSNTGASDGVITPHNSVHSQGLDLTTSAHAAHHHQQQLHPHQTISTSGLVPVQSRRDRITSLLSRYWHRWYRSMRQLPPSLRAFAEPSLEAHINAMLFNICIRGAATTLLGSSFMLAFHALLHVSMIIPAAQRGMPIPVPAVAVTVARLAGAVVVALLGVVLWRRSDAPEVDSYVAATWSDARKRSTTVVTAVFALCLTGVFLLLEAVSRAFEKASASMELHIEDSSSTPSAHSESSWETVLQATMPLMAFAHLAQNACATMRTAIALHGSFLLISGVVMLSFIFGSVEQQYDSRTPSFLSWCFLAVICLSAIGRSIRYEAQKRDAFATEVAVKAAEADANDILHTLLPGHIVQRIVDGDDIQPEVHSGVAIMVADLKGFTSMASTMDPRQLMLALNTIYSRFDLLVERRKSLFKVDTVGDAYVITSGLFDGRDISSGLTRGLSGGSGRKNSLGSRRGSLNSTGRLHSDNSACAGVNKGGCGGDAPSATTTPRGGGLSSASRWRLDSAGSEGTLGLGRVAGTGGGKAQTIARTRANLEQIFDLALAMQRACADLREELGLPLQMRIGVHCGTVITGIVGSHRPRFGVFGTDLLAAEQLQALAKEGEVMASPAAHEAYLACSFGFFQRPLPVYKDTSGLLYQALAPTDFAGGTAGAYKLQVDPSASAASYAVTRSCDDGGSVVRVDPIARSTEKTDDADELCEVKLRRPLIGLVVSTL